MNAISTTQGVLSTQLAWDTDNSDEKKYWRILGSILLIAIVFSWLVASTLLKEKAPATRAEIPERFVKLVLEQQKKIVTPPPPKIVEEVKPEPEKPEPKKVEEKPKEIIQPKKQEVAEVKPQGNREDAREKAKKNLAVFDVFADLRDAPSSKKIASSNKMSADVGKAKAVTRDMIVNQSKKGSGGVRIAKASSNLGGTGLEGGGSRQVSSNLAAAKDKQSRASSGGKGSQRPSENIEQFMDRYKSSFFTLYNRALRKNPSMRGEVIFNLVILPNGRVEKVSIVSSELKDSKLERKLLAQIRSINFTAMNVITWNDNYRISFIPS